MNVQHTLMAVAVLGLLAVQGCTGHAGCSPQACARPEPGPGALVIWWPPQLRGGLGDPEHPVDYTVITLGE